MFSRTISPKPLLAQIENIFPKAWKAGTTHIKAVKAQPTIIISSHKFFISAKCNFSPGDVMAAPTALTASKTFSFIATNLSHFFVNDSLFRAVAAAN